MNARFLVAPLVLSASLVAFAQRNEPPIYSQPLQPLTPSRRGVVFSAKLARDFGRQCSRASPIGAWSSIRPSRVEVAQLEAALPRFIAANKMTGRSGNFADFHLQLGALERGGKRLIYINALPVRSYDPDEKKLVWRRGALVVCDGGPGFWGVEWDTRAKAFQNLSYNGPYPAPQR